MFFHGFIFLLCSFLFLFPFGVWWFSFALCLYSLLFGFCKSIICFWFVVTLCFMYANPLPISACLRLVVVWLKHIHSRKKKKIYIFLCSSPTFYDLDVLFYIFMFVLLLFVVVITTLTEIFKYLCTSGSVVNLPANAWDAGSIPGLGRSPGEGNGNLLLYSCLGNPWTEEPDGL